MGIVRLGASSYVTANAATVATGSITPANNTLMIAYVGQGNGSGSASGLGTVSDNASGAWTRLKGDNSTTGGVAEVWARDVTTGSAMTVTYTANGGSSSGLNIIVEWYTGCLPLAQQPGATANDGGGSAYSVSITPTVVRSLIVGSFARATTAVALTALANTTILGQVNGVNGDTAACFKGTSLTVSRSATAYGFSNTAAVTNWIAMAEILPLPQPPVVLNGPALVRSFNW